MVQLKTTRWVRLNYLSSLKSNLFWAEKEKAAVSPEQNRRDQWLSLLSQD
jgi:hypothetical protein